MTDSSQLFLVEITQGSVVDGDSPNPDAGQIQLPLMETDWHGKSKRIHVVRHGQAIHNVQRGYPKRDPPLTAHGFSEAATMVLPFKPDLIISSPMSRAIQTAQTAFCHILQGPAAVPLTIWPDLREAHDAICNKGVSRSALLEIFPDLDFSLCMDEWDYEPHSDGAALERAKRVKAALWKCDEKDIVIVSHRGFISYLVGGPQFTNCEIRSYILTSEKERAK